MEMTYDNEMVVEAYHEWRNELSLLDDINFAYFGDLAGKTIVDFGCGEGSFLIKCLKKGAAYCLGYDANESMIKKATDQVFKNSRGTGITGKADFVVKDIFAPMKNDYSQFDYGVCQYVFNCCDNEDRAKTLMRNMFRAIKPGGRALISITTPLDTKEEREEAANNYRMWMPLKSDSGGKDPFLAKIPVYFPLKYVNEGKVQLRDIMFTLSDYIWSKEKVAKLLAETGFADVGPISSGVLDDMPKSHGKIPYDWLEDFIAAQKPK